MYKRQELQHSLHKAKKQAAAGQAAVKQLAAKLAEAQRRGASVPLEVVAVQTDPVVRLTLFCVLAHVVWQFAVLPVG